MNQRVQMIDPDDGELVQGTVTNISYASNEVTIKWDDLQYECEHDCTDFGAITNL